VSDGTAESHAIPAEDRFSVSLAPYIWLTSLSGTQTVKGVSFDVNESFIDIAENADSVFGLMGAVDVVYKRFIFQLNGTWTTAEVTEERGVFRNGEVSADVTIDSAWVELIAGYRLIDKPLVEDADSKRRFTLDAFGGARLTALDVDAKVTASATVTLPSGIVLNASESRHQKDSEEWVEPIIGLRAGLNISEGWELTARGDIGGFGAGSDFAWQALGAVGYRWHYDTWNFALYAGYRALGQDYSNGGFGWDMIVHGPVLGMQFLF